jgi:hypothetical protein
MFKFSPRYLYTITKEYDGISEGSSSLWSYRMSKAFGCLSEKLEHNSNKDNWGKFNYSTKQIATAKHLRLGFYKRIFRPIDIIKALKFCPVSIDLEIYSSINYDMDGMITMPDEDDCIEEFSHSFNILKYNQDGTFVIKSNWSNWGRNGLGIVTIDYLKKYSIAIFAGHGYPRLGVGCRQELKRMKNRINQKKYFLHIFRETSFNIDNRPQINIEVVSSGGDLVGWFHFSICQNKIVEIDDLFILKEYRCQGIASFLIKISQDLFNAQGFMGYISSHDLIGEREDVVKKFLLKNDLLPVVDRSKFKDARFRITLL